jgi:signal transduction histidine kinase
VSNPPRADSLSSCLIDMHDEERRRIAHDLHDHTVQNLGALSIHLSMVLSSAALDPHAREALQESVALAEASVREIRAISDLLYPPLLDELGLESALRAYSAGYAQKTGLAVELDLPTPMPRFPQAVEIALFRIAEEGLANIHRHSRSRTAILHVRLTSGQIKLRIIDDGRSSPKPTAGAGIGAMRERAIHLGGELTIVPTENGTTIHVVLPTSARA